MPQQCSFPICIYLTIIYVECCVEARAALLSVLTAAPPCCCSPDTSSVPQRGSLTSRRGVRGARGEARTLLIPRGDAPSTELPCLDGWSQIKKPRFQRFHLNRNNSPVKYRPLLFSLMQITANFMRITAYVLRTMLITIVLCQNFINLAFNLQKKKNCHGNKRSRRPLTPVKKMQWSWKCDDEAIYWSVASSQQCRHMVQKCIRAIEIQLWKICCVFQERTPEEEEEPPQAEEPPRAGEAWRDPIAFLSYQSNTQALVPELLKPPHFLLYQ